MPSRAQLTSGQSALLSTDLLAYYRRVAGSPLTVVDVETTGAKPYQARVIEVSVLQASLDDGIQHQETFLINPGVRVPAIITEVTGITTAMLQKGVYPEEAWFLSLPYFEEGVLTAHNLAFDYSFIKAEYRRLEVSFNRPIDQMFCTVLLSRLLLADLPSRSLPDLVNHFGFDVGRSHRAEADTKACWLLAKYLLTQIREESDERLLSRFSHQWVRLKDAAKLLQRPRLWVKERLDGWGAECRTTHRNSRFLYRRHDVEKLYWELQAGQLSLESML